MKNTYVVVFCYFVLLNAICSKIYGQSVADNSGKDIFTVRTINKISTGISTTSAKANYSSYGNRTVSYFHYDSTKFHLTKGFHSASLDVSVKGITQSYDKFFTSKNQPTVEFNAGWIVSNVLNFNNWDTLKKAVPIHFWLNPRTFDFYVGGYVSKSFINYWDTTDKKLIKGWEQLDEFIRIGVRCNANLYYTDWFAIALNGSVDWGKMTENLKGYQESLPAVINSMSPTIVQLGEAGGKYGKRLDNTLNSRISIGLPIFLGNLFYSSEKKSKAAKTLRQMFIMPHYSPYGAINTMWTQTVGGSINILGQPYGKTNSTIVLAAGLGVDWKTDLTTSSGMSSPIYYVNGTVNLGSLIPKSEKTSRQ